METKSRYEVIADLEAQKRGLIREKDELNDQVKEKEIKVTGLERNKQDIERQKEDFELQQTNAIQDLDRQRADFNFKIGNTEEAYDRKINDAKDDLEYFKSTVDQRKSTIKELIDGVNESLERFGKLQTK